MRSNSSHREYLCARHDDRSAIGERISRRTSRSRHHETVSLICIEILAVDIGTDTYHRCCIALQDCHIVEGIAEITKEITIGLNLDKSSLLDGEVILCKGIDAVFDIIGTDVGKESQTPHVDTEDGDILMPYAARCLKERTVATHGDDEVGIKIIAGKHLGGVDTKTLIVFQEVIVLHIDIELRIVVGDTREHLLDAGGFTGLIDIAEKGEL